jgi:hypothetical protein
MFSPDHQDEEYAATTDADTILEDYKNEIGSHSYMPKDFLGIATKDLGFHIVGKDSTFLALKNKLVDKSSSLKVEDRMQGVRYLCSIPFNDALYHCVEAAMSIISDESIDIYKRYYFLSNNEKFYRLDAHVTQFCYPAFFNWGVKGGPSKTPYDLMQIAAKYILANYGQETSSRQKALDWCLDVVDNEFEDDYSKRAVLEVLLSTGQLDELQFATEQVVILDNLRPVSLAQQAKFEKAQDILRALRKTYSIASLPAESTELFVECYKQLQEGQESTDRLESFFDVYVIGPELFEGLSIRVICNLVYEHIKVVKSYKTDIIAKFIQADDALDILLSLDGIIQPQPLELVPSVEERLRNDVFAGLNSAFMSLGEGLRSAVEESRGSDDKSAAREFIFYFEDEKQELLKTYTKLVSKEEFEVLFKQVAEEWIR